MRHLRLLIMALIFTLGYSVQTLAQDTPAPAGPAIEIGDAVIADAEIRGRIQTIFREIDGLDGIRVSVSSAGSGSPPGREAVLALNGRGFLG